MRRSSMALLRLERVFLRIVLTSDARSRTTRWPWPFARLFGQPIGLHLAVRSETRRRRRALRERRAKRPKGIRFRDFD